MSRRSIEQWQELFKAFEASGLTQADFCQSKGLNAKYFSLRRKQLGGATNFSSAKVKSSPFVQAAVVPRRLEAVRLRYADAELVIPQTVDVQWLGLLLKQLA